MASPGRIRNNHRGRVRNCNKFSSIDAGEGGEHDANEVLIGMARSTRGAEANTPTKTRARGQPNDRVAKRGSAQKKGDLQYRNVAPGDADAGPGNTGRTSDIGGWGNDAPADQGGADDDDPGAPFTTVDRGKGRGGDSDSKNWYKKSNNSKKDFARGQVWNVPYHVPNLDPSINSAAKANEFVKMTFARAVHSKYRHVVVLWKFLDKMIVVPLYSFGGSGITRKNFDEQKELIEIINHDDTPPDRADKVHKVLKVRMNSGKELTKPSCVRLAAAFSVDYQVLMNRVGDLLPASQPHLLKAMDDLIDISKSEPF